MSSSEMKFLLDYFQEGTEYSFKIVILTEYEGTEYPGMASSAAGIQK